MKPLFIYPVKECSTRLPGKNLKIIGGVPMFVHGLRAGGRAQKIYIGSKMVLSTESGRVINAALDNGYGAYPDNWLSHLRDGKYAKDPVQTAEVCKLVIEQMKLWDYDPVVMLQPDNPFIFTQDIINCLELYAKMSYKYDCVRAVTEVKGVYSDTSAFGDDTSIYPLTEQLARYRSLGSIMVCSSQYLLRVGHWPMIAAPYILPKERSYDVNDELDFICAKAIMERRCESPNTP